MLMIYVPNVLHALMFTYSQYLFEKFVLERYKNSWIASCSTFLIASSYIIQHIMTRTFSNAFECSFLMIGVYYWHKSGEEKPSLFSKNFALMTLFVTLSFIFRNSSAIPWIPLLIYRCLFERRII